VNGPEPHTPLTLGDKLRSKRNVAALGLMICGVVLFAIFHFVPINDDHGWQLWVESVRFVRSGRILRETEALLGISSFITLTIGTIACPCMINWIISNPWMKWSLSAFAAMAAAIMWYFTAKEAHLFFLILALVPTFTLAGLLCLKSTHHLLSDRGL
jgi:hypothetical protein